MSIAVNRITRIWEKRGVLSDNQYGFRPNRSYKGPTIQALNAQEEAEDSGTEIHGSSWDINRAFDTVPKSVLILSWERLGVPSHVANDIIGLDRPCLTVTLTPHAQYLKQTVGTKAFTTDPTTDTTVQGYYGVTGSLQVDTPSPPNTQ